MAAPGWAPPKSSENLREEGPSGYFGDARREENAVTMDPNGEGGETQSDPN